MAPTRNETKDPYDAEGEEEPQNARSCRRRTEDYKTHRHRRLFNAGTEKPIPPASTGAMDTSDDCPGPAAEPASPRQTLATAPETMDTNDDCPAPTSQTTADKRGAAEVSPQIAAHQDQAAATQTRPTPRTKPANWANMSKKQKNHWKQSRKGGKRTF